MKGIYFRLCLMAFLAVPGLTNAQPDLRKQQFNLTSAGLAMNGYDPVSYFTGQKPLKGKKEFAVYYEGVTYRFASLQNKQLFISNPSGYEPQYGGWCAFAMGENGEKVEVDPETFKLLNGKLYLFYNAFFNNTLKSWNKNEAKLKGSADINWKKFYH